MEIRAKLITAALASALLACTVAGAHAAPAAIGLPAPTNLAPADGANASLPVTLDWSAVSGAQSYHLLLEDKASMQTSDFYRSALATSYGVAFAVVPDGYLLQYGHTYIWSVQACTTAGCGAYSPATEFTIGGYPGYPSTNPSGPQLQTATIPANSAFDFRTGVSAPGSGEIYYSAVSAANYMGVTVFSAGDGLGLYDFGVTPFDNVTLPEMETASYSAIGYVDNKNGPADLTAGDVFAVSLAGGSYVKVEVVSADYSQLTIQYELFS